MTASDQEHARRQPLPPERRSEPEVASAEPVHEVEAPGTNQLLALQSLAGNQAVTALLTRRPPPAGTMQRAPEAPTAERETGPSPEAPSSSAPGSALPVEAAPVEAAPVEAGPVEAGPVEGGPVEAGPVEGGPDPEGGSGRQDVSPEVAAESVRRSLQADPDDRSGNVQRQLAGLDAETRAETLRVVRRQLSPDERQALNRIVATLPGADAAEPAQPGPAGGAAGGDAAGAGAPATDTGPTGTGPTGTGPTDTGPAAAPTPGSNTLDGSSSTAAPAADGASSAATPAPVGDGAGNVTPAPASTADGPTGPADGPSPGAEPAPAPATGGPNGPADGPASGGTSESATGRANDSAPAPATGGPNGSAAAPATGGANGPSPAPAPAGGGAGPAAPTSASPAGGGGVGAPAARGASPVTDGARPSGGGAGPATDGAGVPVARAGAVGQPATEGAPATAFVDEVATANPGLSVAIAELTSRAAEKRAAISTAADASKAAIRANASARRQSIESSATSLRDQVASIVAAARAGVTAAIGEQRTAITTESETKKATLRTSVLADSQRLSTESATIAGSVRDTGADRTQAANDFGEAQAARASGEVGRQGAAARSQGSAKAGSISDGDQDRAETQKQAAGQVADAQGREVEKTAPDLGQFAREKAGEIAVGFSQQAEQVASGIEKAAAEAQPALTGLLGSSETQIDAGAQVAMDGLATVESEAQAQFDTVSTEAEAKAAAILTELAPQVDATEQAALDQIDGLVIGAHAALDASTDDTAGQLAAEGDGELRAELLATGLADLDATADEVATALGSAETEIDGMFSDIDAAASTGAGEVEQQVAEAAVTVEDGVRSGADGIVSESRRGIQTLVADATQQTADAVDQSLDTFGETEEKTATELDATLESGQQEITNTIDTSLQSNEGALTQLNGNMDEAASKAAEEYDRPWWKKALYAVGKAVLYLAAAIVLTLILALLIFAVGSLLVAAGVIAKFTFAVALTIAVVVLAVGFAAYEFDQRLKAYEAEHGQGADFWTGAALLGISALSLIGIPQVIEGLRGKRFYSDKQLSSQEQYDLVIGGVLQFVLVLFGGKIMRSRSRSKPTTEPGPGDGGTPVDPARPAEPGGPAEPARPAEPAGPEGPDPAGPEGPGPEGPDPGRPEFVEPERPTEPTPADEPQPAPATRELGLRPEAVEAMQRMENIKKNPVGEENIKPGHNHYSASRKEAAGEVVQRRQDGRPFSHIRDLQQACDGLFRVRDTLAREMDTPPDTMTERGLDVLLSKSAEVNRLINRLAGFLNEIGHGSFPPYHDWPPGS